MSSVSKNTRRGSRPIAPTVDSHSGMLDRSLWRLRTSIPTASFAGALSPLVTLRTKRSEEHTSELQSLMRLSYAVFCLKKKKNSSITMSTPFLSAYLEITYIGHKFVHK